MGSSSKDLKLITLASIDGFGILVDEHLRKIRNQKESFIVPIEETRFNNGEGKIRINSSIRDKDVYILSDIGNYSITYPMYDFINHKSPDDHFQDMKRVIYAIREHSKSNSIITPLLYQSRQHRRRSRESLDCAVALQDFINLGVKNIITFDVHDLDIQNAIPKSSFESFYPTREIIETFIQKENIDLHNMFVIAPDSGAVSRANLYANLFKCNMGFFRKERDLSKLVDGKNPITQHHYVGGDFKGKNILIVDDMIASGGSMLDVVKHSKALGANKIYLIATFALFTKGIDIFNEAYEKGLFDKIYTTNLTYIPNNYKQNLWLEEVDCSLKVAQAIDTLNRGNSLNKLINDTDKIDIFNSNTIKELKINNKTKVKSV